MEDDLNILENGRRPKFFEKGRLPKFFLKMEDDVKKIMQLKPIKSKNSNIFVNEDDLNFCEKEDDFIFLKIEDDIKI